MEITILTLETDEYGEVNRINPVTFSRLDSNEFNLLAELASNSPHHAWE